MKARYWIIAAVATLALLLIVPLVLGGPTH